MTEPIPFEDFGGQGPILHFAHPNAYPPACFAPLLQPLTASNHVIAVHHRPLWPGHDPDEFQNWQIIADDLVHFLQQQGLEQIIGVGHSLGAVATMKAAVQHPHLFRALVLIDPVFLDPEILQGVAANPQLITEHPRVARAQKRRARWPDRQTAFDHYRQKEVFKRWPDEALWFYVNEGLVETAAGDLELFYSREWEAQVYTSISSKVWEDIPRLSQPTLAIRGAESDTFSPKAWEHWQTLQPEATFLEIADAGHMVPMERPSAVIEAIREFQSQLDNL